MGAQGKHDEPIWPLGAKTWPLGAKTWRPNFKMWLEIEIESSQDDFENERRART